MLGAMRVLVTGAGRSIGRATAQVLTERGHEVVATARDPALLHDLKVAQVLLKLEPSYREVLVLRFHEEMSLEEIAGVTRAPLSTVKSRLYRGLAALKPEIEQLRACRMAEAPR